MKWLVDGCGLSVWYTASVLAIFLRLSECACSHSRVSCCAVFQSNHSSLCVGFSRACISCACMCVECMHSYQALPVIFRGRLVSFLMRLRATGLSVRAGATHSTVKAQVRGVARNTGALSGGAQKPVSSPVVPAILCACHLLTCLQQFPMLSSSVRCSPKMKHDVALSSSSAQRRCS